ncbi:helix-turn-helix domain-containing protein [Streptomyces sp. NPDC126933]|uniref:helix-turn-helix domain-containing protein n=1 Tax=unclassified Streptomyces TaxID=2593676 RepID=UPI00365B4305
MDITHVPTVNKTEEDTGSKFGALASTVTNTLDSLTPAFVPFARRWDAEADRRHALRTPANLKALIAAQRANTAARSTAATAKVQRQAARKATGNPLSAERRAARTADKGARRHKREARGDLTTARANYPATLRARALQAHAVHLLPASAATLAMSSPWPASVSASLAALNAGALWLGRRAVVLQVDDELSSEERLLVGRLDPSWWVGHAPERGLEGTVTTPPEITPGGIRCSVRLDGTWTVKGLADKTDNIRNLLGARTSLRIRITSGTRGGWAVISLATRKATDGTSSLWTPDLMPVDPSLMSLGVDTETGEHVLVPFDERLLVSGASGTGKSWSTRPLMATAHLRGDLVLIDGKGEEANIWEKVCRVAIESGEIDGVIDETHAEMTRRKREMKSRGISVWDGRQITVVIDEGQVVLSQVARDKDRLQRLVELSSLGRSRGVVMWWATQYPVTDGRAPGVHNLIAPNLLTRFSLRVAGTTQAQVALDDCANYAPHQIPQGKEWRGHGYLKGYGPRMIRTWTLDDAGIKALPSNVWNPGSENGPDDPTPSRTLTLVKEEGKAPADRETRIRLIQGAQQTGARTVDEIAESTGIPRASVGRILQTLKSETA